LSKVVVSNNEKVTTFYFDFWFLPSFQTHKHGNKDKLSINRFSLFTCKLVIWKKLVRNENLNRKFLISVLNYRRPLYFKFWHIYSNSFSQESLYQRNCSAQKLYSLPSTRFIILTICNVLIYFKLIVKQGWNCEILLNQWSQELLQ